MPKTSEPVLGLAVMQTFAAAPNGELRFSPSSKPFLNISI